MKVGYTHGRDTRVTRAERCDIHARAGLVRYHACACNSLSASQLGTTRARQTGRVITRNDVTWACFCSALAPLLHGLHARWYVLLTSNWGRLVTRAPAIFADSLGIMGCTHRAVPPRYAVLRNLITRFDVMGITRFRVTSQCSLFRGSQPGGLLYVE